MVYAEISAGFEAITPVTYLEWAGREIGVREINLLSGEKINYFGEIQAFNMDKNLPLIPQIVEEMYDSDNLPKNMNRLLIDKVAGFYIKSGLIKVTIVDDEDYVTQNQGDNKRVMEMFYPDTREGKLSDDTKTKITAFGDVMEFQSKLNSAIKQRYELLRTNFIINYNQTFPQVIH